MPAKPVGIRDIGVEDWFYSRKATDGQPTLDDVINDSTAHDRNWDSKPPPTSNYLSEGARARTEWVMRFSLYRRPYAMASKTTPSYAKLRCHKVWYFRYRRI